MIYYIISAESIMVLFNPKSVCLGRYFSKSKPSYRKKKTTKNTNGNQG